MVTIFSQECPNLSKMKDWRPILFFQHTSVESPFWKVEGLFSFFSIPLWFSTMSSGSQFSKLSWLTEMRSNDNTHFCAELIFKKKGRKNEVILHYRFSIRNSKHNSRDGERYLDLVYQVPLLVLYWTQNRTPCAPHLEIDNESDDGEDIYRLPVLQEVSTPKTVVKCGIMLFAFHIELGMSAILARFWNY